MTSTSTGSGSEVATEPGDDFSVALQYFNDEEAATVEAIAERIIPGDTENPGATEAGVVYYIDRAIAGVSADLKVPYRRGLRALDRLCRQTRGASFRALAEHDRDEVLREFIGPEVGDPNDGLQFSPDDQDPDGQDTSDQGRQVQMSEGISAEDPDHVLAGRLLTIIREHTVEGFFCDPVYGGNRDTVGWRLVGFPGAHWGYTAEQMVPGFDGRALPIMTLSDLRQSLRDLPSNEVYYRGNGAR